MPGCRPDLVEGGARLGIEVDAELIGVVGVIGEVRPQVESEASEIDRPQDMGHVGDDQCVRRRAVRRASPPWSGASSGRWPGPASGRRTFPPHPRETARATPAGRRPHCRARRRSRGSTKPGRTWWRPARGSRSCPGSRSQRFDRPPRRPGRPWRPSAHDTGPAPRIAGPRHHHPTGEQNRSTPQARSSRAHPLPLWSVPMYHRGRGIRENPGRRRLCIDAEVAHPENERRREYAGRLTAGPGKPKASGSEWERCNGRGKEVP